jgi:hypothetical protein
MQKATTLVVIAAFALTCCDDPTCPASPPVASLKQSLAACKLEATKLYKPTYPTVSGQENFEMKNYVQPCMEVRGYTFRDDDERCGLGSWSLDLCYKSSKEVPPPPPGFKVIDQ